MEPSDIKHVQSIFGTILYYDTLVDNIMLVDLGYLALVQTKSTASTLEVLTKLLNYANFHPNVRLRNYASDTTFHIHINGSYLSVPK